MTNETFDPGEDLVDTERAFLPLPVDQMTTGDLLTKLEDLRARRGAAPKSTKKAAKQEKEAKLLVELEKLVPDEYKEMMRGLSPKEKKEVLLTIIESRKAEDQSGKDQS